MHFTAFAGTKPGKASTSTIEPSELNNFEAISKSDKVELSWDIHIKSNHVTYVLERSKNGVRYEKIAKGEVHNSSNNTIQFIETDHKPLKGKVYYRLKIITSKHETCYSSVLVLPNEVSPETKIPSAEINTWGEKPVLVVLRDSHGKEYFSKIHVTAVESRIIGTDTEHKLKPGKYTIKGTSLNALYSHELIVK
jgi:hypothetical protein